ncbi:MAG: hypothetical protein AAGF12_12310 [Myxococcota bacterium]
MAGKRKRPGKLLAIAIIGLCIGLLGCGASVMGMFGAIMQQSISGAQAEAFEDMPGTPEAEIYAVQARFQERINEYQAQWMPYTVSLAVANGIVSAVLLLGTILILSGRKLGLAAMTIACALAIPYELSATAFGSWVQMKTIDLVDEMMAEMMATTPNLPPDFEAIMSTMMSGAVIVGMIAGVAWLLLKLGYYVTAIVYLRKSTTKASFDEPAPGAA